MSIMGDIRNQARSVWDKGVRDQESICEVIYNCLSIARIDEGDYLYELPGSYESVEEYVMDLTESWRNEK